MRRGQPSGPRRSSGGAAAPLRFAPRQCKGIAWGDSVPIGVAKVYYDVLLKAPRGRRERSSRLAIR